MADIPPCKPRPIDPLSREVHGMEHQIHEGRTYTIDCHCAAKNVQISDWQNPKKWLQTFSCYVATENRHNDQVWI